MTTCVTCGSENKTDRHRDVSGFCERDKHGSCDGNLLASTGTHWWCACTCHPQPRRDKVLDPDGEQTAQALDTWRRARALLEQA